MAPAAEKTSESMLVFILAAVQFVHILDMMMVIPLGPDFAEALNIRLDRLGWIGGSYTLASSLIGVLAAVYLDRYDRKRLLIFCLCGLTVMTGMGAVAWNFESLVAIRFITGLFGGPCTALCFAVVADTVPDKRRGTAVGRIMAAFSIASVLGVPFGLELAHSFSWQAPFYATAAVSLAVLALAWFRLPPLTGHMTNAARVKSFTALKDLLFRKIHWQVFAFSSLAIYAAFLLIPHLATYVQYNLGLPRDDLGFMYMAGGAVSFVAVQAAGWVLNRVAASKVSFCGMAVLVFVCYTGMIHRPALLSPLVIYVLFMSAMSVRGVSANTLASKIPSAQQRAGFLALVACISQLCAALGAFTSVTLLHEAEDKSLVGFDHVAWLAIAATVVVPPLMWWVERHVRLRKRAEELLPPPGMTN